MCVCLQVSLVARLQESVQVERQREVRELKERMQGEKQAALARLEWKFTGRITDLQAQLQVILVCHLLSQN